MKTSKKLLALLLVAAMLVLTGCGMDMKLTLDETGKVVDSGTDTYLSEEDFKELYEEDPSAIPDLSTLESKVVGDVTYYKYDFSGMLEDNGYDLGDMDTTDDITSIQEAGGFFDATKFELPYATYGESSDDLEMASLTYQMLDFTNYIVTFPYQVLKANGSISEDGYTVTYDFGKKISDYPKSGFRFYAAFDQSAVDATDIKVSGVTNGKRYSTSRTITVSSPGVISYLKVNGRTVEGNTFKITKNGDYTIVVKLVSGATRTVKFSIRKYYKLYYKVNGGKALKTSTKKIRYGYQIGKLATPTRSGYRFLGWYTKKTGGTKVTYKKICKGNLYLYAHWKKK